MWWSGAVLISLGVLLGAPHAAATPHWEAGPKIEHESLDGPLPLADGRVLVCRQSEGADRCEFVDPVSGAREAAPIGSRSRRLAGAISLADGSLLLPYAHEWLEPRSGAVRALPPSPRKLSELRGIALAGARAAFVSTAVCDRVLFFLGFELGFRDILVAPAGTCVQSVFDLGDGRVLISRTTELEPRRSGYNTDFVVLGLGDLKVQAGPRVFHRDTLAAFVHRGEIVVLLRGYERNDDGSTRCEALFLDRNLKRRDRRVFAQGDLGSHVTRVDADRVLLFDRDGALLWDPTRARLSRVRIPAPTLSFVLLRRNGVLVAMYPSGQSLILRHSASGDAPCRGLFTYAEMVAGNRQPYEFHPARVDELMSPEQAIACREQLDREQRLPSIFQAPLEALLARRRGEVTPEETLAARVLCTLTPSYALPLIEQVQSAGHLDAPTAQLCDDALELHRVLAVVGTPRASRELVRYGLQKVNGRTVVRSGLPELLERRRELKHHAGALLAAAHERKARGFDALQATLCASDAAELERVCNELASEEEQDFDPPNPRRPRLLLNLGLATGFIGGLTTLAYFARNSDGGRAIAIGSGIVGGGTLGAVGTFVLGGSGSELQGLGTLLLAVPITIGGAVAGGAIATQTSRKPGDGRFATAAVPLAGLWLTGVGLTIHAW